MVESFSIFITTEGIGSRAVRLTNLVIASGALLISFTADSDCRVWAGSPPPSPHPLFTLRGVMMDAVVLIWFSGAIGLLYRKSMGWFGSVLGSGITAGFFVYAMIFLVLLCHHPNAELTRLKDQGGLVDYRFGLYAAGVFMSIPASISALLFVGLLFKRKELVTP